MNQELPINSASIEHLKDLVTNAGIAILEIYHSDNFDVELKSNDSPVTKADLAAHNVLIDGLASITPNIPVISEEDDDSLEISKTHTLYWLIDPLDGTKEFINKSDEFTVNLALISDHKTIFGIVGIPALDTLYWGGQGFCAFKSSNNTVETISVKHPSEVTRVFASKSHLNPETEAFINSLAGTVELVQAGSSLKFLRIAEGDADIYPRIAPTCEWDTAAAHAVLEGAGGTVTQVDGSELVYGKADILNPYFIAKGLM